MNNDNPFAAPEKGALPADRLKFPNVEFSAFKTPETWVSDLTAEKIASGLSNCKLGFHYWDKDASVKVQLSGLDKTFTFVVLETYSRLSGVKEIGANQFTNYYSNIVKDTRIEKFALYEQGQKRPIVTGLYAELKGNPEKNVPSRLPKGVGFEQVFVVYCVEQDRVFNLPLTTMVSREIKQAISDAEKSAGRSTKPENVKLFGLADTGHLWGFRLKTFRRAQKDGSDWKEKSGELFFVPSFYAGVIKSEGEHANPELHATCLQWQEQVRANYAAEVERRKRYGDDSEATATESTDENLPTSHDQGRTIEPQRQQAPIEVPDELDPLPF